MVSTWDVRDVGALETSYKASEAFSTRYLFAKKPTTRDTVAIATNASDEIIGIAQRRQDAGEEIAIKTFWYSLITAWEDGIAVGDKLRPGTGGKAYVADTAWDMVVAIADAPADTDEQFACYIIPNIPRSLYGVNGVVLNAPTAIANSYVAVKSNWSDEEVVIATGNNDEVIGVAQHTTTGTNQPVRVDTAWTTKITAWETIAVGDKIRWGTLGKWFVADEWDNYFAIALESGSADSVITIVIVPNAWESVNNQAEIKIKQTTIQSADVLTLNATPVELVADPGDGYAISVHKVIATVDYWSSAYATNTTLEIRYTNGSGTKVTADITWLLDATWDKAVSVGGIEAELELTASENVVAVVATGDPTGGDSDIKLTVIYSVVKIA